MLINILYVKFFKRSNPSYHSLLIQNSELIFIKKEKKNI